MQDQCSQYGNSTKLVSRHCWRFCRS